MRKPIGFFMAALSLLCTCDLGLAQSTAPSSATITESITLPMQLTGAQWKMITNEQKGTYLFQEFVPVGDSGSNWHEMVTVQTFGRRPDIDTSKLIVGTTAGFIKGCGASQILDKRAPVEGGFQTYDLLVVCRDPPPHPEMPNVTLKKFEVLWLKGIQGKLGAYLVQRAWHSDVLTPDSILQSQVTRDNWRHWIEAVCLMSQREGEKAPHRSCGQAAS